LFADYLNFIYNQDKLHVKRGMNKSQAPGRRGDYVWYIVA